MLICTFPQRGAVWQPRKWLGNPKHHIACGKTECVTDCHQHGTAFHNLFTVTTFHRRYGITTQLLCCCRLNYTENPTPFTNFTVQYVGSLLPLDLRNIVLSLYIIPATTAKMTSRPLHTQGDEHHDPGGCVYSYVYRTRFLLLIRTDRLYYRYQLCHRLIYLS